MKDKSTILVVDDDNAHRIMLSTLIGGWGYEVSEADDGATAIDRVKEQSYDLVLMDVRMVHVSGLEALAQIKLYNPAIPVIIMTAYSSVDTAVKALKQGAHDYLTKPLDFEKLRITIGRAMEHTRLKEENRLLKESLGKHFDRQNIIGQSPAMINLLETVAQVAQTLRDAQLPDRVVVDCSHGNSRKDYNRQPEVANDICEQVASGSYGICGVMMESHLVAGRQDHVSGKSLTYGQSITDACISWDMTVPLLDNLAGAVAKRRKSV